MPHEVLAVFGPDASCAAPLGCCQVVTLHLHAMHAASQVQQLAELRRSPHRLARQHLTHGAFGRDPPMHPWKKNQKPGSPLRPMHPGTGEAATALVWQPGSEPHQQHALLVWRGLAFVEHGANASSRKHRRCLQTQAAQASAAAYRPLAAVTATLVVAAPLPVVCRQLAAALWQSLPMLASRAPPYGPLQGRQWHKRKALETLQEQAAAPAPFPAVSVCPFPGVTQGASLAGVATGSPRQIFSWTYPFPIRHAAQHQGYLSAQRLWLAQHRVRLQLQS
mmetsp:Transcript_2715/g.5139  ORF Transcript_2715/g.5139 Transcript_2715/m.5139 type:complete len:278 (+) Transcript_2715:1705-2538(+)